MSASALAFTKYQALGNDFLIVDLRASAPSPSPELFAEGRFVIAKALCCRRYGVGGDGVLILHAPSTPGAAATMRVLNSDGSEAEMCGNGLRCVARFLLESDGDQPSSVLVDTLAGPLDCEAHWLGREVIGVTVNMGRPHLVRSEIPMLGGRSTRCIEEPLALTSGDLAITAVSMGNPHAVTFVTETGDALQALATNKGPLVELHASFPSRTNVEFAHIVDAKHIELWVWERGCGITQACGTGACATVVAACLTGRSKLESEIEVTLPGGVLAITVAKDYETVYMRGPAEHVFDGTMDTSKLDVACGG
ncbi:MAG: diaminopimelate epimerase [Myxococcales bacterium]|nr:diaminopimelate epimerase [Myxococcales bacterium]